MHNWATQHLLYVYDKATFALPLLWECILVESWKVWCNTLFGTTSIYKIRQKLFIWGSTSKAAPIFWDSVECNFLVPLLWALDHECLQSTKQLKIIPCWSNKDAHVCLSTPLLGQWVGKLRQKANPSLLPIGTECSVRAWVSPFFDRIVTRKQSAYNHSHYGRSRKDNGLMKWEAALQMVDDIQMQTICACFWIVFLLVFISLRHFMLSMM